VTAMASGSVASAKVVFDQLDGSDRCRTPLDFTDLALTVEGTVEVAARQEWGLHYRLDP
jgi:hypothetical protein